MPDGYEPMREEERAVKWLDGLVLSLTAPGLEGVLPDVARPLIYKFLLTPRHFRQMCTNDNLWMTTMIHGVPAELLNYGDDSYGSSDLQVDAALHHTARHEPTGRNPDWAKTVRVKAAYATSLAGVETLVDP